MNYWRMQLHPDDSASAGYYANQSIATGFIGGIGVVVPLRQGKLMERGS